MNFEFTEEEIQILIQILDSVSIQGTEAMKKVIALSEKLKKEVVIEPK